MFLRRKFERFCSDNRVKGAVTVKKTINVGVRTVEVVGSNGMDIGSFGSWFVDESDGWRSNDSGAVAVERALCCEGRVDSATVRPSGWKLFVAMWRAVRVIG